MVRCFIHSTVELQYPGHVQILRPHQRAIINCITGGNKSADDSQVFSLCPSSPSTSTAYPSSQHREHLSVALPYSLIILLSLLPLSSILLLLQNLSLSETPFHLLCPVQAILRPPQLVHISRGRQTQ